MEAMFDAWWGKDDAEDESQEGVVEIESEAQSADDDTAKGPESEVDSVPTKDKPLVPTPLAEEANRQFASLPEVIPLTLRIELLQLIQSNLKQQLAGALESTRGFLETQIAVETDEAKGGFLGIGGKKQTTAIKFKHNSVLLSKFETLINRYETDYAEDTEKTLDYDQQLRALTQYVDQIWNRKIDFTVGLQPFLLPINLRLTLLICALVTELSEWFG